MSPLSFARRHARRVLPALAAALLLVACGGGTTQYEPFSPLRLFAFGDESSLLTGAGPQPETDPAGPRGPDGPTGRRYGVNGIQVIPATTTSPETRKFDCDLLPTWVQLVGDLYNFVFAECNPAGVAEPQGRMHAQLGAKVAALEAQIDAARAAAGGFTSRDLATVMIGANDILELYRQSPAVPEAELLAEAQRRGRVLAAQVNRLIALGPRVLLVTAPDMGLSPYARAQDTLHAGTSRVGLLSRLTQALNEQVGVSILLDGRFIGLVQADQMVQAMNRSPQSFGLSNVTDAACAVALPDCTSDTLVLGASASGYLWADGTRLSYGGQERLGILAQTRATRNPF